MCRLKMDQRDNSHRLTVYIITIIPYQSNVFSDFFEDFL